jgi:kynurenine formamidase
MVLTSHPWSRAAFDEVFSRIKTWTQWGEGDERGTLNYCTPEGMRAAAALVRQGRSVSLARPVDTTAGPRNPRPALHYMSKLAGASGPEPRSNRDFIGTDFHGSAVSHLDALSHMSYEGRLYNGALTAEAVTAGGASFGSVAVLRDGIITRGVLLDVARHRGAAWVDPPLALGASDMEALVTAARVHLRPGDAVLIRSGQPARAAADPDARGAVGLAPDGLAWLADRRIALLGADDDSDARPSPVEGLESPIHALALVGLGMCLLDNLDLERLSEECSRAGTAEFLLVVAPLIVPGGTGSPVNPIAVL